MEFFSDDIFLKIAFSCHKSLNGNKLFKIKSTQSQQVDNYFVQAVVFGSQFIVRKYIVVKNFWV